jgi:hypothetical protein
MKRTILSPSLAPSLMAFLTCAFMAVTAPAAEVELSVAWTGSANEISITVLDPGGHPEWVGYDLQRRTYAECGSEILLNESVLSRQAGQPTTYVLEDFGVVDHTLYEYKVFLVDAARQPISLCAIFDCDLNPFIAWGQTKCASLGAAPIATGFLSGLQYPMTVDMCPGTCGLWYFVTDDFDLLEPYAGSAQAVFIFGNVSCENCGPEGCVTADITEVVPVSCPVGVANTTTWGAVKSRYR